MLALQCCYCYYRGALQSIFPFFQLMRHFEIKPDPQMGELKSICRTVLIPHKPVSLRFLERGTGGAAWFWMALKANWRIISNGNQNCVFVFFWLLPSGVITVNNLPLSLLGLCPNCYRPLNPFDVGRRSDIVAMQQFGEITRVFFRYVF